MVDSTDHISAKTGLTVTVTVSKAGGAFGAAGGTITEVSSGWYKIALTTTDTNTLGDLAYHCTSTGADATDFVDQISARLIDDLAFPATSGRSMVVDAAGLVDANVVKVGPTGAGTAQTARDIGASVLLSTGTGTGQLDFTSGVVKANATQLLGGTIPAPNVTGVPLVDLKYTLGTISPATAGSVRADAVTGAVGSVTGNVGGNVVGSVASVTAGVTVTTNNDKTAYTVAASGIGSGAITAAEKNNIADACLDRRLDVGTDSSSDTTTGRTWRSALRQIRNKVAIVTGTATVYKEDDATASHTAAITTTAGNPISTIDPT